MSNNIMGRPTLYTQAIVSEILARVAGGESLRKISLSAHMPDRTTITEWLLLYPDFSRQYQHAYKTQMLLTFDEMKDIVDEADVAEIPKVKEQIAIRKWILKIHEPKKYGDNPVVDEVVETSGAEVIPTEILDMISELQKQLEDMQKNNDE